MSYFLYNYKIPLAATILQSYDNIHTLDQQPPGNSPSSPNGKPINSDRLLELTQ